MRTVTKEVLRSGKLAIIIKWKIKQRSGIFAFTWFFFQSFRSVSKMSDIWWPQVESIRNETKKDCGSGCWVVFESIFDQRISFEAFDLSTTFALNIWHTCNNLGFIILKSSLNKSLRNAILIWEFRRQNLVLAQNALFTWKNEFSAKEVNLQ